MTRASPEPKRPKSGNWIQRVPDPRCPFPHLLFDSVRGARVMSSCDRILGEDTPSGKPRLEFHVSISFLGGRAGRELVDQVLREFEMVGASEDNHQGPRGIARNFWLPVDPEEKAGCPCEAEEPVHDEGNDYRWREAPDMPKELL